MLAGSISAFGGDSTSAGSSLRYILASAMFGKADLATIIPEVHKVGADAIDIWPAPHGNQREQVDRLGVDSFGALLNENNVKLGSIACYVAGPFALAPEIELVTKLKQEGVVLVCGAKGPKSLAGEELKNAVLGFVEKMKPHVAQAAKAGCTVAVENHANDLLEAPDGIRWFCDMVEDDHFGLALAPHHLPQDAQLIAGIVRDAGPRVKFFYAQQHGKGFMEKVPKADELMQMPGRGPLDFRPIVQALKQTNYTGYTEIFMHPVPRGVPILDTPSEITAEINRSRKYLDSCRS